MRHIQLVSKPQLPAMAAPPPMKKAKVKPVKPAK